MKTSITNRISYFEALYALVLVGLPFIYSYELIDPVLTARNLYISLFVILGFSGIGYLQIIKKKKLQFSLKLLSPITLTGLIVLISFLSILWSFNEPETLFTSIRYFNFFATLVLTYILFRNQLLRPEIIHWSILAMAAGFIALLIFQVAKSKSIIPGHFEYRSSLANKNLLGSALFIAMISINYLFHLRRKKIISIFFFVLFLAAFYLIKSKAAWLANAILVLGTISFYVLQKLPFSSFIRKWGAFLIPALAGVVFIIFSFNGLTTYESGTKRIELWKGTVQMIPEYPLTGTGAGNWKLMFPEQARDNPELFISNISRIYQRPHNDFLWVFSELGIIPLLAMLCLIGLVISIAITRINASKKHPIQAFWIINLLILSGIIIILNVSYILERPTHLFVLAIYLGMTSFGSGKKLYLSKLFTPFIVLIAIFFGVVLGFRFHGERIMREVYNKSKKQHFTPEGYIQKISDAQSAFYNLDPLSIPLEYYKGLGYFADSKIEQAKASFELALQANPTHIASWINLASCLEKMGNSEEALQIYDEKCMKLAPSNKEVKMNILITLYNQDQYNKALDFGLQHKELLADPRYQEIVREILETICSCNLKNTFDIQTFLTKFEYTTTTPCEKICSK